MKTPKYTYWTRLSFVFKITAIACLCVICGIYIGFSPRWIGLPTDLATLLTFGITASILIAAPLTYWAGYLIRQNYIASRELAALSHKDHLSGGMSRAYLENFIQETPNLSGVILMIDIDNFKAINDTHGHIMGDVAISQIGKTIKSNIRETDSFYRFGGEEFVVILANASPKLGNDIAWRICKKVEQTPIFQKGDDIYVTISIGGAAKTTSTPFETSLALADQNLYHVKQSGRNDVKLTPSQMAE
jgi:diguanylate cyclase (GGDEF)-like protein